MYTDTMSANNKCTILFHILLNLMTYIPLCTRYNQSIDTYSKSTQKYRFFKVFRINRTGKEFILFIDK